MGWILRFVLGFRTGISGFWDFGLDSEISGWILGIRAGFSDFGLHSGISGWTLGLDLDFGLDSWALGLDSEI